MSTVNSTRRWPRRALAALLEVDKPAPPRSDAEIAIEVEDNYSWNFTVNLLDATFFLFGLSFVSSATILPLFVSKLTPNPLAIGLVAAIAQGGWFLPQLLTANTVERLNRKKPVVVNLGLFLERLPMWVIVLSALVAGYSPILALALFFLGFTWHMLGAGAVATAWQDLVARWCPVDRRGRFFGISTFLGTGMGAAGALVSTWLLKTFAFPTNFVYTFVIAAAGISLSWFALALTREPVQPVDVPRQSNREFLIKLPDIVRRDQNFRRFLVARSLMALGSLGTGFVTVAAIQQWQVPDGTVGLYTIASLLGQAAGNLTFGLLADRFGHKLSLEFGALTSVLAFVLALVAPSAEWFYVVFFLMGMTTGAVIVSGILVVLEFSESQRRPTYAGMANTAVGLVSLVAPLLGAWLAMAGYGWVFAASIAINLVAYIAMRWWVREPRWTETIKL